MMENRQVALKKIIYDTARKDKEFLRVLKEYRLYGRYFHMLKNYGFNIPRRPIQLNMEEYVMNGFGWGNDTMFPLAWVNLYQIVKTIKGLTGHGLYEMLKKHQILLETNRK